MAFSLLAPITAPEKPVVRLDTSVQLVPQQPDAFQVIMQLTLAAPKVLEGNLTAVGLFELGPEATPEQREQLMRINAPAIMFPYVRAFLSSVSAQWDGGRNHIILPPYFFHTNASDA